jgi:hypothetical protein
MGRWQSVVIIPLAFLYETNNWIPSCPITVGLHNTTKTSHLFTVLTWRTCIPRVQDKWSYSAV